MPHIRFSLAGPFPIPFIKHSSSGLTKQISPEQVAEFWQGERVIPFADKQGCYIFALRNNKVCMPWYVGKTSSALSDEAFAHDKLTRFNTLMFKGKRGTPVVFFVTKAGKKEIISDKTILQLEKLLIHMAKVKNPDLLNIANTKNIEDWSIGGVFRSKKKSKNHNALIEFKKMMGLD